MSVSFFTVQGYCSFVRKRGRGGNKVGVEKMMVQQKELQCAFQAGVWEFASNKISDPPILRTKVRYPSTEAQAPQAVPTP